MSGARYQHTIHLPEELERGVYALNTQRAAPESFNALVNRLIRQEMDLLCVTDAPTSTIQ